MKKNHIAVISALVLGVCGMALAQDAGDTLTPEDRGITVVPSLAPKDMDIFIDNYAVIVEALGNVDEEDERAEEYLAAGNNIEMDDDAGAFWETFTVFLNCPVPTGLENAFKSIGWKRDGQKKFWTILICGSIYKEIRYAQDNLESLSEEDRETMEEGFEKVERFLQVFHPADRKLIRSRLDDLL